MREREDRKQENDIKREIERERQFPIGDGEWKRKKVRK